MKLFKKDKDISNIVKKIENQTGDKVVWHKARKKDFSDTSLDIPEQGMFYAPIITPGYIIDVKLRDNSGYECKKVYHSNLEGSILKEKP